MRPESRPSSTNVLPSDHRVDRRSFVRSLSVLAAGAATGAALLVPARSARAGAGGPWLGVTMEKAKAGLGVAILHAVRGSPAAKAGILDGDRLLKVDGGAVASPADVSAKVAAKGVGGTVALELVRGGKVVTASATLVARPAPEQIFRMELVGEKLPALPALKLVSGPGPVSYPKLDGRVVLIDLFATWCGPCLQLGPYYHAFHAKYGNQGLSVLAVSPEDTAILAGWSAKNSVGYTVAADPSDLLAVRLSAPALPSSVLVDKHAVVRDVTVGFELGQVKRTEQLIQALLKEP